MSQYYTIKDSNGVEVGQVYAQDAATAQMSAPPGGSVAPAVALPTLKPTAVPAAAVETAEQALTRMLDVIDDERENLSMKVSTPGGIKKTEYAAKEREWRDYDQQQRAGLLVQLLAGMDTASRRLRWPWIYAEVDDTGDTLQVVMARVGAAVTTSPSAKIRAIAARAQKLKRALRAATASGRPAIFNARTWPS